MRTLLKFAYEEKSDLFVPALLTSYIIIVTLWRITCWNSLRTLIKRTTELCIQPPSAAPFAVSSAMFIFSVLCMLSEIVMGSWSS